MPSHWHYSTYWNGTQPVCMSYVSGSNAGFNLSWQSVTMGNTVSNLTTSSTGSGGAHNHGNTGSAGTGNTGSALSSTQSIMQPYVVMYIWRRTD